LIAHGGITRIYSTVLMTSGSEQLSVVEKIVGDKDFEAFFL